MSFIISPPKVLNLVVFSMFTKLWNLHPYLEHSIIPIEAHSHQQLPPPQPLTTRNPLCVCGSACSGHLPSVESHPVCPFLPEHLVLRICLRGSKCQGFSPFHGWVIFHPESGPCLLYSFTCWWALGCLHLWAVVSHASVSTCVHFLVWT